MICQKLVKVRYLRSIQPKINGGKIPMLKITRGINGKRILRGKCLDILLDGMGLCFYKFMFVNLENKLDIWLYIFVYAFLGYLLVFVNCL